MRKYTRRFSPADFIMSRDALSAFKMASSFFYKNQLPDTTIKAGLENECKAAINLSRASEMVFKFHDETGIKITKKDHEEALMLAATANVLISDAEDDESDKKEPEIVREANLAVYLALGLCMEVSLDHLMWLLLSNQSNVEERRS